MNRVAARFLPLMGILSLLLSAPGFLPAQTARATLAGTVTDASGTVIPNARITVKNVATGGSTEAKADASGFFNVQELVPGEYEVTASATGFSAKLSRVTLAPGAREKLDFALSPASGNVSEPTLNDLGFTPAQAKGSAEEQARLDKRSYMLKIHQRLGLITIAPMVAAFATSSGASGRGSTASGRDLHATLGGVTAGLYFTSASYAMFAPKIAGTTTRGPIRLHKTLAWIHGPGMILTPILGALAFEQRNQGERIHGIASAHGAVATVTGIAYGLSILSVTIKF